MPAPLAFARFRAALFDIDGTLLDSMEPLVRGLGDAYEHLGVSRPSDDEIKATLGTPLRVQLTMFGLGDATPEEIQARSDFAIDRFEHYADLERELTPAVEALRLAHERGWKTALVTSKSRKELDLLLARFRGGAWADALVCASDVAQPKPSGECALLACQRLGVEPQDAVMIGDSIFDIRCARDAGTAIVAVSFGATDYDTLAAERPDLLFRRPEELYDWVAESALKPYGKKEFSTCST